MVKPDELAEEITKELARYAKATKEKVEEAKDDVSKELVKDLKSDSPKQTGSYKKGWRRKKTKLGYIIHNKTDYQLTHLLEHGHAKKNGGRVSAKVHIRPNEEKAIKVYLEKIEKAVKE